MIITCHASGIDVFALPSNSEYHNRLPTVQQALSHSIFFCSFSSISTKAVAECIFIVFNPYLLENYVCIKNINAVSNLYTRLTKRINMKKEKTNKSTWDIYVLRTLDRNV